MITKEQLMGAKGSLKNSLIDYWNKYREAHGRDPLDRRNPNTVISGVIHPDEIDRYYKEQYKTPNGDDMALQFGFYVYALKTSVKTRQVPMCFFTDDGLWNYALLRNLGFQVAIHRSPVSCYGGTVLNTTATLVSRHYDNRRIIKTTDELVDYLNNI